MAEYIERNNIGSRIELALDKAKAIDRNEYQHGVVKGLETAADIVNEHPIAYVQPVDRWISVKDRLPENNKLVLCYAISTTGEGSCYVLGALSNGEFWFLKVCDGKYLSFPNLHLVITHWQPLPEPPANL